MKALSDLLHEICPPDEAAGRAARDCWDGLAKPLGSLGLLEQAIGQIAAITGSPEVTLERRALAVLCADNGVVVADSAPALVMALNRVLFPTLGRPTIPNFIQVAPIYRCIDFAGSGILIAGV